MCLREGFSIIAIIILSIIIIVTITFLNLEIFVERPFSSPSATHHYFVIAVVDISTICENMERFHHREQPDQADVDNTDCLRHFSSL